MASSLQLRRVSRPSGAPGSGGGTMLTSLRLTGQKPPKLELDERTQRSFPDFTEQVWKFNEALVEWWKRVAVLIDAGGSETTSSGLATLQSQYSTLSETVRSLQQEVAASASAGGGSTTPRLALAAGSPSGTVMASSSSAFSTSASDLIEWTQAERYRILSAATNESGHMTTATVRWPDGSMGTFTALSHNSTHLAIDSYQITHLATGRRVVQPPVVRDSNGFVTSQPNLIVL